jgi:DNA modification methylase
MKSKEKRMIELVNMDAMEWLNQAIEKKKKIKCFFNDPPDNLGLQYDGYNDKRDDYYNWIELLLMKQLQLFPGIVWLSYFHGHDLEIKYIIRNLLKHRHPLYKCDTFIWRFTFGQYRDDDCGYGYRPIVRLKRDDIKMNVDRIRVFSTRQLIGDKRAGGDRENAQRTPDNVWTYSRIQGNNHERQSWHLTQHPEKLMKRIIELSLNDNEVMVDCFCGSGTSLRVMKSMNINGTLIGIEQSKFYCEKIMESLNMESLREKN